MENHALAQRNAAIIARFGWSERLLFRFSKNPEHHFVAGGYVKPTAQWTPSTALSDLLCQFPHLKSLIRGKRVLDYGCGDGFQAVAMAEAGAAFVLGVDIVEQRLNHARRMARGIPNVVFARAIEGEFDVAISLNSFEHFPEPDRNLDELAAAITPGGLILITFGSPWLSPYGSHMNFFTDLPWVNVLFPEKTVFRVRQLYRDDTLLTYVPLMNKMTIRRFERIIAKSGLKVVSLEYKAIRNFPVLSHLPGLREFFLNRVNCILTR
ncbi:MAG: class I SAM-dependent methyltransferase [Rhodospirillaceae bacterium]